MKIKRKTEGEKKAPQFLRRSSGDEEVTGSSGRCKDPAGCICSRAGCDGYLCICISPDPYRIRGGGRYSRHFFNRL